VVAVGNRETLIGLMLAGVKTRLETEDPSEALDYLRRVAEKDDVGVVIITSDLYQKIKTELAGVQERRLLPIFFEFPAMKLVGGEGGK
jgi:vacuolar-type H+-ATPase subunit F/Vma7